MKSTVSGGLMLGVIAAAAIMISSSIMISYSYAPTKEDVELGLSNRLNVAANEVEDRGSDAAQKLRDKASQIVQPTG